MPFSYIEDYKQRVRDNTYSQFKGTRIDAFIKAVGEVLQMVEDDTFDLLIGLMLDNAQGETLNRWGKLVDEQRQGLADQDYRRVIRAKIRATRTSGNIADVLEVISALTDDPEPRYVPAYPAAYRVEFVGEPGEAMERRLKRIVEPMAPAGVGQQIIKGRDSNIFRLDSATAWLDLGRLGSIL